MRLYHKHLSFLIILSIILALIFIIFIFLTSASHSTIQSSTKTLSKENFVLGTIVTITLYDHQSEELLDSAFNKLTELENILSINKTNTLIDSINSNAGISPVVVDESTYHLIEKGIYYSKLTSGAFDLTIGPIVKLWDIGFPSARIPSNSEIQEKLSLVDYRLITLDEANHSVYLNKRGMCLDLGGIGKGYAADEVAQLLKNAGVQRALINLGGNIYALGDKPSREPWTIGIQNPFSSRGNTIGTIHITNQSVVTSGIYERYITDKDGTTYHHILNPDTGYPFTNDIAGVTIVSDFSTDGDALSTAAFALGVENGLSFIEKLNGIDAIFITTDKKVYVTSGIKGNFRLQHHDFKLYN